MFTTAKIIKVRYTTDFPVYHILDIFDLFIFMINY